MFEIIQEILKLIREWISFLLPWHIMGDDQVGLIRRVGKFHRYLKAGWNWKVPIIEQCFVETSALDSTVLREQTLTTKDGKQVTLRGVLTTRIVEPRAYILGCATAVSVVHDVGCMVFAELIPTLEAETILKSTDFQSVLLRKMRQRAKRWGVEVDSVGVVDRVETPTFRLITSQQSRSDDAVVPGLQV